MKAYLLRVIMIDAQMYDDIDYEMQLLWESDETYIFQKKIMIINIVMMCECRHDDDDEER